MGERALESKSTKEHGIERMGERAWGRQHMILIHVRKRGSWSLKCSFIDKIWM